MTEEAEVKNSETAKKEEPKKVKRSGKQIAQITRGRAYIQATYNNTIVTIADANGNVLAWSSAGKSGFKGPKKATPYAAGVVVKDVIAKISPYGLKEVVVFVKGVGSGREGAVRALNANGINVLSIKDVTPLPHNGPLAPRARRL